MSDTPSPPPSPLAALRERLLRAFDRKLRQTSRMSRNGLRFSIFLAGAMGVAVFSLVFSWVADTALAWQRALHAHYTWAAFVLLPPGLAALRWLTLRVAPQARGSGIPQVIATQHLPPFGVAQTTLVSFPQALWKIGLTAVALFLGASVGREGPSVQVGAAAMLAWGAWWQHRAGVRVGFHAQALLTAGAAGGLAAAFNTPLAGVVFAIEELGKGASLRWDRLVLAGVLASGFLSLAIVGNNPYFQVHEPILFLREAWPWIVLAALVCGVFGGLFAKLLLGGVAGILPAAIGQRVQQHPVWTAFGCGVVLACIGASTHGDTYGTGLRAGGRPAQRPSDRNALVWRVQASRDSGVVFCGHSGRHLHAVTGDRCGAGAAPVATHRRLSRRARAGAGVDGRLPGGSHTGAHHGQRDRHGDDAQPEHDVSFARGDLAGVIRIPAVLPAAVLSRSFAQLPA